MNGKEIGDYSGCSPQDGRHKLNRDPFGRRILRALSEHRGTVHDYFSDPKLVRLAANLLDEAKNPEEQQCLLATIDRDLRILNGYFLKLDYPDIRPVIEGFMARVKEAMHRGNCIPVGISIQSTSQKTWDGIGRILELTKPDRPK